VLLLLLSYVSACCTSPTPANLTLEQRHGETDHNRAKIIQGHLDTSVTRCSAPTPHDLTSLHLCRPLNAEGEAQAVVVARFLGQTVKFDEMWSSDLQRARKVSTMSSLLLLHLVGRRRRKHES
jgi:hypothetical protein